MSNPSNENILAIYLGDKIIPEVGLGGQTVYTHNPDYLIPIKTSINLLEVVESTIPSDITDISEIIAWQQTHYDLSHAGFINGDAGIKINNTRSIILYGSDGHGCRAPLTSDAITVHNASFSYTPGQSTGTITISNPTGVVSIEAKMRKGYLDDPSWESGSTWDKIIVTGATHADTYKMTLHKSNSNTETTLDLVAGENSVLDYPAFTAMGYGQFVVTAFESWDSTGYWYHSNGVAGGAIYRDAPTANITISLSHISTSNTNWTYSADSQWSATFTAANGYSLPNSVTITGIDQNGYTWNSTTGVLTIAANTTITSNTITITIAGVNIPQYQVTIQDDGGVVLVDPLVSPVTVNSGEYVYLMVDGWSNIETDPVDMGLSNESVDGYTRLRFGPITSNGSIRFYQDQGPTCYIKGTLITMADGSKKAVENISYDDDLLVWDFDNGQYTTAKPLWIMRSETDSYNQLTFSDGTILNTVADHRIFNKEAGKFTYVMNGDAPIGTTTFTDHNEEVQLVDKQVINQQVEYYNIITYYHINLFANSILTSSRLSNLYPIKDLKYIKDNRQLVSRETYAFAPDNYFYGLRLAEQLLNNNGGQDYFPEYEDTKIYVQHLLDTDIQLNREQA